MDSSHYSTLVLMINDNHLSFMLRTEILIIVKQRSIQQAYENVSIRLKDVCSID
jgi:hypothetical protein